MESIPRRIINLWGFKDNFCNLPGHVASLRKANLEFLLSLNAGWSFALFGPSDVLQIASRSFKEDDAELIIKALSVSNHHWIQRVDMARFAILYAMGGLYLDLDVQINACLDEVLSASLILKRGSRKTDVELDIVGAIAGDSRILDLLRKQAQNVLKKRGHGICPDAAVSLITGVRVIASWTKEHGLSAKPLANRFIQANGRGDCKAVLKTHDNESWAATIRVKKPLFVVHHTASWCRAGRGLNKSAFKPTIKDTSSLGKLKAWNAQKQHRQAEDLNLAFHPTISLPPVMDMVKKGNGNLMCQLSLLRAAAGSFPEAEFKPLWTASALADSEDTTRMNLARVLVTKVLNEEGRLRLVNKIAEPCGKLLRATIRALIKSKGVMTPTLHKFLQNSYSVASKKTWKTKSTS
jgi:hypothetical protein